MDSATFSTSAVRAKARPDTVRCSGNGLVGYGVGERGTSVGIGGA